MASIREREETTEVLPLILAALQGGLEQRLIEFAGSEAATSVTRLALSKEDFAGRRVLRRWMEDAGMKIKEHPLGLAGVYEGLHPNLPPVALMSHFDSVPNGGKYDGVVGVISSIAVVQALHDQGVRLNRGITVIALTGEESSRFNLALFGSRGMFQGLTQDELASRRPQDLSIGEALEVAGFNPQDVTRAYFTKEDLHAVVELHVSQDSRLEETQNDLAVIEAIAAPDRYQMEIGEPLEPDPSVYAKTEYLQIEAQGKGGHSGSTPMGKEHRADALVPASDILITLRYLAQRLQKGKISIGPVLIEGQALNKIPGHSRVLVRLSGESNADVADLRQSLEEYVSKRNQTYLELPTRFEAKPLTITELREEEARWTNFFSPEAILLHQDLAGRVVHKVNRLATKNSRDNIVGTVGTYHMNGNGQIILGIDIRGIDRDARDRVVEQMKKDIRRHARNLKVRYNLTQLPGSSDPVRMDNRLIALAEQAIKTNNLGSCEVTFSPAGHDVQNAARAGIPTVMIFIPSRNGGISHHPDEYSTAQDLERGAKAQAALAISLASEP